jgi:hypothetical protein
MVLVRLLGAPPTGGTHLESNAAPHRRSGEKVVQRARLPFTIYYGLRPGSAIAAIGNRQPPAIGNRQSGLICSNGIGYNPLPEGAGCVVRRAAKFGVRLGLRRTQRSPANAPNALAMHCGTTTTGRPPKGVRAPLAVAAHVGAIQCGGLGGAPPAPGIGIGG